MTKVDDWREKDQIRKWAFFPFGSFAFTCGKLIKRTSNMFVQDIGLAWLMFGMISLLTKQKGSDRFITDICICRTSTIESVGH